MPYQLSNLLGLSGSICNATLAERIEKLIWADGPRFRRLWAYYRNPMRACGVSCDEQGSERPYRQAQEWGLPSRITGLRSGNEIFCGTPVDQVARKEVVIENDIGWRIDTMADYLFGKPIVINSAAPNANRRAIIEQLLRQILAHNGGIVFLQQLALLGAVYGHIDVLVKFDGTKIEDRGSKIESGNPPSSILNLPSSDSQPCGTSDLGEPPATENPSPTTDSSQISAGPESGLDGSANPARANPRSRPS